MKTLAAALVLVSLVGCNAAVTAYNHDRTKSWMCVPNTTTQPPLRGIEPLVITEPTDGAAKVAKK